MLSTLGIIGSMYYTPANPIRAGHSSEVMGRCRWGLSRRPSHVSGDAGLLPLRDPLSPSKTCPDEMVLGWKPRVKSLSTGECSSFATPASQEPVNKTRIWKEMQSGDHLLWHVRTCKPLKHKPPIKQRPDRSLHLQKQGWELHAE